mgnify:CR=1 FL=1
MEGENDKQIVKVLSMVVYPTQAGANSVVVPYSALPAIVPKLILRDLYNNRTYAFDWVNHPSIMESHLRQFQIARYH